MREAFIGLLGVLIGGGLAAITSYVVNERQVDVKMIEIAVDILKQDPNGGLQPARKWAVDVIRKNASPRLSDAAYEALTKCSLIDPNDKFGRIGATAMENAPGLQGAVINLPKPCLPD
jgi:hypothetical protein